MFSIYLLELRVSLEELVKFKVKSNAHFIVLKPEYACAPRFVQYAFLQAFKAYAGSKNIAKTLELEWLCKLALTQNVSSALQFTRPENNSVALAGVNCFENKSEVQEFGVELKISPKFRKESQDSLVEKYGVSQKAFENYNLENLLIETAAVENIS